MATFQFHQASECEIIHAQGYQPNWKHATALIWKEEICTQKIGSANNNNNLLIYIIIEKIFHFGTFLLLSKCEYNLFKIK